MKTLILIGEQGSGKGTAAKYLVKKYHANLIRFSKVWDDILARLYIPNERVNIIALAEAIRGTFGEDILARIITKDIIKEKRRLNVVDGMRMPSEYPIFKKLPGFAMIHITAPMKERYQNIIHRGERANENKLSFAQFKKTELTASTEVHIPAIAKHADYRIENVGTKKDLYRKVDEIMKQIQKKS
jgi:dephospho-CoA kinase